MRLDRAVRVHRKVEPVRIGSFTAAEPARSVFVTGGSGFLGRYILRELVRDQPRLRLRALVRDAAARDRISGFLPEAMARGRLSFVEGDLTQPGFGLSPADVAALSSDVSEVWHVAAITDLRARDAKPLYDTNVGGTARMLAFAGDLPALRRFHFVSTAYVAGCRSGPVPEGGLPGRPVFRNSYEQSKHIAEQLVLNSGLPVVVYRPSIILGDSATGYAGEDCQTVYRLVNALIAGLARAAPCSGKRFGRSLEDEPASFAFRLPGSAGMSMNFVCVDEVARLMRALSERAKPGRVLNLTNRWDVSGQVIKRAIEAALNIRGTAFAGRRMDRPSPGERITHRLSRPFLPYIMGPGPTWDTRRGREILGDDWIPRMTGEKLAYLLRAHVENLAAAA